MKKIAAKLTLYFLVTTVVSGTFFLPQSALAAVELLGNISVQETDLAQSAFVNLGTCNLIDPTIADPPSIMMTIDVPPAPNNTAYYGADQPRAWLLGGFGYKSVWFCNQKVVEDNLRTADGGWHNPTPETEVLGFWDRKFVGFVGAFMSFLGTMAAWVIWLTSVLLEPLLSAGSFITNPMVKSGWPFVQGIANLGFLLALLFIAFATTLRLESFGVRRMLPRLLIAALLINFSLVITGLLIDVSRLVMASLLTILNQSADIDDLALGLLKSSNLIRTSFDLNTFKESGYVVFQGKTTNWQTVASVTQATVLMWGLAVGLIMLVGGLLMRYIILILLLIVSPLAFLAVALPNTGQLAQKWWSTFIKYVLYGPIAVFILVLTVAASRGLAAESNLVNPVKLPMVNNILNTLVVIAMMIAAATASSKLGVMGAGAALSFVSKQGQRVGRFGLGVGKGIAQRTVVNPVKDVTRNIDDSVRKSRTGLGSAYRIIRGVKRGKDGEVAKGEVQPWTQKVGKRVGFALGATGTERKQVSTAQELKGQITAAGGMAGALANPALAAQISSFAGGGGFRNAEAASHLGADNLADYARHSADGRGLTDLAQNIEKITVEGDFKTGDLAKISQGFANNSTYKAPSSRDVVVEIYNAAGVKTGEQKTNQTAVDLGKFTERIEKAIEKKTAAI